MPYQCRGAGEKCEEIMHDCICGFCEKHHDPESRWVETFGKGKVERLWRCTVCKHVRENGSLANGCCVFFPCKFCAEERKTCAASMNETIAATQIDSKALRVCTHTAPVSEEPEKKKIMRCSLCAIIMGMGSYVGSQIFEEVTCMDCLLQKPGGWHCRGGQGCNLCKQVELTDEDDHDSLLKDFEDYREYMAQATDINCIKPSPQVTLIRNSMNEFQLEKEQKLKLHPDCTDRGPILQWVFEHIFDDYLERYASFEYE